MNKKIVSLILVGVLGMTLVGCNSKKDTSEGDVSNPTLGETNTNLGSEEGGENSATPVVSEKVDYKLGDPIIVHSSNDVETGQTLEIRVNEITVGRVSDRTASLVVDGFKPYDERGNMDYMIIKYDLTLPEDYKTESEDGDRVNIHFQARDSDREEITFLYNDLNYMTGGMHILQEVVKPGETVTNVVLAEIPKDYRDTYTIFIADNEIRYTPQYED